MTGSQESLVVEDDLAEVELIGRALRAAGVKAFHVVQELGARAVLERCEVAGLDRTVVPSCPTRSETGWSLQPSAVEVDRRALGPSHLPVVMFTSSETDGDLSASYRELADAYIGKPQDSSKLARPWRRSPAPVRNKLSRFGIDVFQRPALLGWLGHLNRSYATRSADRSGPGP